MSYIRKRYRRSNRYMSPVPMGDLASTLQSISGAIGIASDLASDPYLPETVCRFGQMSAIDKGQAPPACATTADGLPGGVGIRKLIKPLRYYVYADQHKWVYAAVIAGVIGLPLLIGYNLGRGR